MSLHLLFLVVVTHSAVVAGCGNCFQFNYNGFGANMTNISLQHFSSASGSTVWLLPYPDPSKRTDPANASATITWTGWIIYSHAVPFLQSNTNSSKSFNTSFTFQFFTPGAYGHSASGMLFFIGTSGHAPEISSNKYFGFTNGSNISPDTNPFFGIEFDTFKSDGSNDPSASHIGIDYSIINSASFIDTSKNGSNKYYPELYLYNNYTFRVWIAYNASSQKTKVWMTNRSSDYSMHFNPPNDSAILPILQHEYDLSSVFIKKNEMYVGFASGTKSTSMLGVAIYSWYFSIDQNTGNTEISNVSNRSKILIITSTIIAVLVIAVASFVGVFFYIKRKSKQSRKLINGDHDGSSTPNITITGSLAAAVNLRRFSYQELEIATNGFDNSGSQLIGEGGFSRVYRGDLVDGSVVAIKRVKEGIRKEAEFISELKMISAVRHRNLLQLLGWSYDNGEGLLVYKLMSNGSLNKHLFGGETGKVLDSSRRLSILSGVASALEYLHFGLGDCVLHRDVKAANVLLTEDFEAVLADFGLALLIRHNESITATIAGTPGYVAPEVVLKGKVTDKADVYSFGVLALEIACGRQAIVEDPLDERQVSYIVEHVSELQKSDHFVEALDPVVLHQLPDVRHRWERVLNLAMLCCRSTAEARPNMRLVSQEIQAIINHDNINNTLSASYTQFSSSIPSFIYNPALNGNTCSAIMYRGDIKDSIRINPHSTYLTM